MIKVLRSLRAADFLLATYLMIVAFPTFWYSAEDTSGATLKYQIAGVAVFLGGSIALQWRHVSEALAAYITRPLPLLFALCMSFALFRGAITGSPLELVYAAITLATMLCLSAIWLRPPAQVLRQCRIAVMTLVCYLGLLFYVGPVDVVYRHIGVIHPNLLGATALAAMVLAWPLGNRWRIPVTVGAIGLMYLVSSRNTLLAAGLCLAFPVAVAAWKRTSVLAVFFLTGTALLGAMVFGDQIAALVNDAFQLDNADRGLGSGGSGRMERWANFLPQISERPWLGYGFRQREAYEGTHNAILNALLENGVVAGMLLLAVVGLSAASTLYRFLADQKDTTALWLSAGVTAFTVRAGIEPQLLNLGDAPGVVFMFLLAGALMRFQKEPAASSFHAIPS